MAMPIITNADGFYALHAYVLPSGVMKLDPFGRVTFRHIYQNRPKEARYAVAGHYSPEHHSDRFLTWDLFSVNAKMPQWEIFPPKPRLLHADLDAAIMATVMLYGSEER